MKFNVILCVFIALVVSSCARLGLDSLVEKVEDKQLPGVCPQVGILEDAKDLTLFSDKQKTADSFIRSTSKIKDFDGGCDYKKDKVFVDLDLYIQTKLGPKARIRQKDKVTIVLPYFIAIADPAGEVVAKEVFAAAVRFKSGEESKEQIERLRQVIPLDEEVMGPNYRIFAGFQLTQKQLDYNREQKANWIPDVEDPRPQF